jgi:hypothetical protein
MCVMNVVAAQNLPFLWRNSSFGSFEVKELSIVHLFSNNCYFCAIYFKYRLWKVFFKVLLTLFRPWKYCVYSPIFP